MFAQLIYATVSTKFKFIYFYAENLLTLLQKQLVLPRSFIWNLIYLNSISYIIILYTILKFNLKKNNFLLFIFASQVVFEVFK